ncbi:MAG TPA: S53 family peptidase [Steroidobacteraceae bacterium]|jgi:kumamolisin|nr:S53 family peptidase [Steroidobacteraceae bacterium]
MRVSLYKTRIAAAVFGMIGAAAALAASPAMDLGAVKDSTISITVALKLSDLAGAEAMMQRLATPGDPMYLKFLTPEQARTQFGPNEADVQRVIATLSTAGLTVQRATATTLNVTGRPATFEQVFQTRLHQFAAAATSKAPASTFRAAVSAPVVPAAIASVVTGVIGLNTNAVYRPHVVRAPAKLAGASVAQSSSPASTGNQPGFFTVQDFAAQYDANPLYAKGVTGKGRTLGIVTLANITPSDVFAYWSSLKLKVNPHRLKLINIDGGPGAPSDNSGSFESTLDVEQSGGIAPGADIVVYLAPNTNQGFLDAFAQAVSDNKADSFSTSWGIWELFNNLDTSPVTDEFTGETVSTLQATHEVLVLGALQGQSAFGAAGDSGAYDADGFTQYNPLSVDSPASDTAITAAGGTTLPIIVTFTSPAISVTVPTERVWGWDYFNPVCAAAGVSVVDCGFFPGGGGGGVSVFFTKPFYQLGIFGTQLSQPDQTYANPFSVPVVTEATLPAFFPGRNVPDVSFNADPYSGYVVAYTSDGGMTNDGISAGFAFDPGWGGTSFVGPQLNGVTALLGQNAGHRFGLLNVPLYLLASFGFTHGPGAVLHTIAAGDNWFYYGRNGYSPAAGLGTIDVFNLSQVLR